MGIIRDIVPELVPAAKEASQLCEVCGSWHVDDTFDLRRGRSVAIWASQMSAGEVDLLPEVELVSCLLDILFPAFC